MKLYGLWERFRLGLVYILLSAFAFLIIFPFFYMFFTSLKAPEDVFVYPPRLLPRDQVTQEVEGFSKPLPMYKVQREGETQVLALAERSVRVGIFAEVENLDSTVTVPLDKAQALGTEDEPETKAVGGETYPVFRVTVEGEEKEMIKLDQTALGRFVDPDSPSSSMLASVRKSQPVEKITFHFENYLEVLKLKGMGRSLTNTILVTILVVVGQLTTSVLGGYAFARLEFPGRDVMFLVYLGTMMVPFVVLIIPLYQLMVVLGWMNTITSLVVPWIFSAYSTFMMRQFFLSIPKEIEEAAIIDGASRLMILRKIFLPASTPALATQATFTFLYAWNSFLWPLIIINTGNYEKHVLTLSLSQLQGQAVASPNLIMAGASIAILPPLIVFIFAQRYFIESVTSSGIKG